MKYIAHWEMGNKFRGFIKRNPSLTGNNLNKLRKEIRSLIKLHLTNVTVGNWYICTMTESKYLMTGSVKGKDIPNLYKNA